jgi:hypothetical protein
MAQIIYRKHASDATDSTTVPAEYATSEPSYRSTTAAATCAAIVIYVSASSAPPAVWFPPSAFSTFTDHALDQIRRPLLPFPRQKRRPISDRPSRIERLTVLEMARPPPCRFPK